MEKCTTEAEAREVIVAFEMWICNRVEYVIRIERTKWHGGVDNEEVLCFRKAKQS